MSTQSSPDLPASDRPTFPPRLIFLSAAPVLKGYLTDIQTGSPELLLRDSVVNLLSAIVVVGGPERFHKPRTDIDAFAPIPTAEGKENITTEDLMLDIFDRIYELRRDEALWALGQPLCVWLNRAWKDLTGVRLFHRGIADLGDAPIHLRAFALAMARAINTILV